MGNIRHDIEVPETLLDEIELLVNRYKVKHIEIIDDIFTVNSKRVENICDEIISRKLGDKINMWCFPERTTTSKSLMLKMKKAGINWVFMGFESGSDSVLQGVNKNRQSSRLRRRAKSCMKRVYTLEVITFLDCRRILTKLCNLHSI